MREEQKRGAADVLFINHDKEILETGRANFFGFKDGILITPEQGVLKGITRAVALEIAEELFPIEKRAILFEELPSFQGAFITSSDKEILPVIQVDEVVFNQGKIYPGINQLIEKFKQYTDLYTSKK